MRLRLPILYAINLVKLLCLFGNGRLAVSLEVAYEAAGKCRWCEVKAMCCGERVGGEARVSIALVESTVQAWISNSRRQLSSRMTNAKSERGKPLCVGGGAEVSC